MMTSPTVAPGSVVVMRRHGTSHDAAPSSFYVPSPLQPQHTSMNSQQQLQHNNNAGSNKQRKSWGERLKLGKSEKSQEDRPQPSPGVSAAPDSYLLQDYRNKYGTLSSGSALSKSMKYAETWLYGSVAVRSPASGSNPRPSLFLYHHPPPPVAVIPASQAVVIPPGTNYAVVMCSCPEFLTGTARSKKSASAVCKKCGGSRMLWKGGGTVRAAGTVQASAGTVRGTLRLGGGSSGQSRVRPSLMNLSSTSNTKAPPQQHLKAVTPDPYDLMRRNRLGGVNGSEASLQFDLEVGSPRVRAKSTSPCRRSVRRSPSPPLKRSGLENTRPENARRRSRRDVDWERAYSNWSSTLESPDNIKRKSILECDVNAYELIAKYLKNGTRPLEENSNTAKVDEYVKIRNSEVTNDILLDDELSDDLSDNALENSTPAVRNNFPAARNQSQISRIPSATTHSKTDNCRLLQDTNTAKIHNTDQLPKRSTSPATRNTGVTLGGQRIRIFNVSPTPSLHDSDADVEFCNETNSKAPRNASTSSSLIPRLSSPRRPPRKMKMLESSEGTSDYNGDVVGRDQDDIENESVEGLHGGGGGGSPNNHVHVAEPCLSQARDGSSPSATEGVCVIKSILKKPSTLSPGEITTSLKTFGDTISKPDLAVSAPASAAAAAAVAVSAASSVTAASSGQHSPSPEAVGSGSTDFYLPTFQEFKQQHRKKKQVQFKVSNDVTVLHPVEEEQYSNSLDCGASSTTTSTPFPVKNSAVNGPSISRTLPRSSIVDSRKTNSKAQGDGEKEEEVSVPVKLERKKKDVRFGRREDKQSVVASEKCAGSHAQDESSDNSSECANSHANDSAEQVKPQYFGKGDVDSNACSEETGSFCDEGRGRDASDDPSAGSPAPAVLGGIADVTSPATETDRGLLKERPRRSLVTLRRSQSDRELRGDSCRQTQRSDGAALLFNDTMRLRLRPGRPDIRQVFSDPGSPGTYTSSDSGLDNVGAPKRPQRMLSPGRPRPKEPPPPPPPPSFALTSESIKQGLPELPPRQIFPFTKKQIEQMNQQARQFSIKSNAKQRKIASSISKINKSPFDAETSVPSNIRPVSWSPLTDSSPCEVTDVINISVKRKEHRHSDPGPGPIIPKLVVHVENHSEDQKDTARHKEMSSITTLTTYRNHPNQDETKSNVSTKSQSLDRNDNKMCTIVNVTSASAPGSPLADVHRLQIKGDESVVDVSPGPQRRTSILINSGETTDELRRHGYSTNVNASVTSLIVHESNDNTSPIKKDSSNKVTISVGGVSDQLLQNQKPTNISSSCTIIDTSHPSTHNSNKIYNRNNCSSLTMLSSSPSQVNVIPVSPDPQVQRTLLIVDHNETGERNDNMILNCWRDDSACTAIDDNTTIKSTITVADEKEDSVEELTSSIPLTSKSRGINVPSGSQVVDDEDALKNPVEAVRRNLVPHVCGKKDKISDEGSALASSPTERLNKLIELQEEEEEDDDDDVGSEALKEGDYFMAIAASKLIDPNSSNYSPLYSNVPSTTTSVSKSSDDTLPTVIEHEEDDDVFQTEMDSPVECDEGGESKGNDHESTAKDCKPDDESPTREDSECETVPYSAEPETEETAGKEDTDIDTSHLLLTLPLNKSDDPETEKDSQEQKVELRTEEIESCNTLCKEAEGENIYESIKDPIYEEIPDTPPPLPLSPPPSLDDLEESKRSSRSIFEGASKYDILSYLVGAKERGIVQEEIYFSGSTNGEEIVDIIDEKPLHDEEEGGDCHQRNSSLDLGDLSSRVSHLSNASDSSEDSCNLIISNIGDTPSSPSKVRKSSAEIERNDSGVGSETSKSSRSRWQHCGPAGSIREDQQHLCEDCDQPVETQVTDSGVMFAPLVCRKCGKKRAERKEIIAEIVETEVKYGRDLQIIMEEFYRPMLVAGLLSPEQLSAIFLNVEDLLEHNGALAEKLRDNMEIALEQGDEDLLTVNIGKLFLEAAPMLHAFESYCTRQGGASLLLSNLEKEKELLRIFLRVSQMENAVLRRMNLNSFLMVPVQRVTKYPLLLARLHKVTPAHHEGRELLRQAQQKIELHLEHMNSEAKDISTTKLWRRISIMNGRRSSSETDMLSIKLRKMALDILEWNHDEVRFAMEGKLLYTNPADNNWRKGRTIKLNPINALLVTNGKPTEDYRPDSEDTLMFPRKTGVREATLLLLKEKCGRYTQLREPLYLDKCIVCSEADWEDYFEVQELASKDTFIFKAEDGDRTKLWYRQLQYHAQGMGAWRRRRNALANIMINGMQIRN